MRLKSIEIKGFKSFGDKVSIHFNDGVTGIVGPNGCGKSNVVDAMRWVLGEQKSRMLRSDKMENVLFNGTKSRKAASLAEVNLSFENSKNILPTEYNTVTITRRLYRSGESEYLLNGVNCRLKDITNLFLDTGIGSDSYAIMELKMIDDILNDKENSRRQLFEEASGVSKYKIRKKETLAKLEDTQADLDRVEDLLFEIDKNMKQLQGQAKKTERFYKLREEYKQASLDLAWYLLHDFFRQLAELEKEEQLLLDKRRSGESRISLLEAEIQQIKLSIVEKEKLLQTRQKATNEHIAAIRQYENEQRLQNERHRFLTDKEQALQKQLRDDNSHREYILVELQKQQETAYTLEQEVSEKKTNADALKEIVEQMRAEQQQLRKALESDTEQLNQLRQAAYTLEKQVAVHRIQLEALQQDLERNATESALRSTEMDKFGLSLTELETKLGSLKHDVDDLTIFETHLADRLQQLKGLIEQSKNRTTDFNRQLDKLTNEYQLTKSLVDNLEGYPESLKFLKKSGGWTKNAQLLSDIISCKPEYKAAIENYLEPWLNYYVVGSFLEARAGVELLANSSKGRASFFVLEAFNNFIQAEPLMLPGCIPALTIAEGDIQYANLINHLLGNVYLYEANEGYEDAHKELTQRHAEAILISRNGRFTGSRLSLAGGSLGLFEGKRIGRKRNLELLQKQIAGVEQQIRDEQELLHKLSRQEQEARESTRIKELNELKDQLNKTESDYRLVKSQQEQHEKFILASKNRREELEQKQKETTDKLTQQEPELEEKNKQRDQLQSSIAKIQEHFNVLNENLQQRSATFNEANVAYHQLFNKYSSVKQDISFKDSQLSIINKRTDENAVALSKTQEEMRDVLKNTDFSDSNLLGMYEQKELMEKAVQEAEISWYQERGKLDELENQIREIRRIREQDDLMLNELKEKANQLKLQETGLAERLSVEFQIAVHEIRDREEQPHASMEQLNKLASEIKEKLDNFGPINPMAVEAYQEIEERFRFIQTQKEDLIKAKASLLETMLEIDQTAREKFMAAFVTIRENFVRVFRSLFTEEDTCDLILTDEANPLDSAIHIVARPKGKKPLTINQLSGGEKTLTATALLFAIYLFKPAPFCIFDEVDAPLDDNNIDKFNRLVRRFSDNSQFIIVTHNKKTMETTDIIYGVTMIEQGVSRVVPVDFRSLSVN